MKKALGLLLVLALLFGCAPSLACVHVDEEGAEIIFPFYQPPTETEDGTTGPGVCSVCGEVIVPPTVILSFEKQRKKQQAMLPQ